MQVVRHQGMNWIDPQSDAAFRRALIEGCPPSVRAKMKEALAATPQAGSAAHSTRYFGKELPEIQARVAPLIDELHWFLHHDKGMPDFKQWLAFTGFANEYRMIKAFVAWAEWIKPTSEAEKVRWPVH